MKKIYLILMVMVMAVISLSSFAVFAESSPSDEKAGVYVIQKGDTLWWLEGFHRGDPSQWLRIVDDNPFLKEPGRIYEKGGKIIVLIKPGEQLKGLVEIGILPQEIPASEFQVVLGTPAESIILYILLGLAIAVALYGLYRLYRIFSGFTFEPGRQVVPEPQTQAITRPLLRVAGIGEPPVVTTRIEVNGLEIMAPEGSVFSVSSDKITISISRAGDIAIGRLKKTKKAKVVKSVAATAS